MRVPLAAVLGRPVGHSRSPALFGHWLRAHGLRGHYVPIEVEPDRLGEVLRALPMLGFRGANVTAPLKEAALALAQDVTPRARAVGAANTLTFGERLHADNTDGHGFLANLRAGAPGWDSAAGPALVLGAGGAARAVLAALLDAGVPEIRLSNRTRARAEALAEAFGPRIQVQDWPPAAEGAALVVNATSLGMTGAPPLEVPLAPAPGTVVTDLVYAPLETPLLAAARARGCVAVDGLGMLLHQAVPGFERWFGATPVVDEATRAAVLAA
jgi:shikimate dehydrogenase